MTKIGNVASRGLGELAIIVIGVLIALWADGRADARSERRDLEAHLRAVCDELREEVETLDRLKALLGDEAEALRSLAAIGTSGDLPPTPRSSRSSTPASSTSPSSSRASPRSTTSRRRGSFRSSVNSSSGSRSHGSVRRCAARRLKPG